MTGPYPNNFLSSALFFLSFTVNQPTYPSDHVHLLVLSRPTALPSSVSSCPTYIKQLLTQDVQYTHVVLCLSILPSINYQSL